MISGEALDFIYPQDPPGTNESASPDSIWRGVLNFTLPVCWVVDGLRSRDSWVPRTPAYVIDRQLASCSDTNELNTVVGTQRALGPIGPSQGDFIQLDEERGCGQLEVFYESFYGQVIWDLVRSSVKNDAHGGESGLASWPACGLAGFLERP